MSEVQETLLSGQEVPIKNEIEVDNMSNMSEKIDKIATALAKVQSEMGTVSKSSVNPFFKSKYADINDVLITALPVLSKNGISVFQGNRYCTISNGFYVTTMLMHGSGQWLKTEVRLPLDKKRDAQAVGSACTYGRRYGLAAAVGIAMFDDDGNAASHG
tara:strand:- start:3858 stop:4334 length:477 start_codon:yes stop_codon:yes gene_type:complete